MGTRRDSAGGETVIVVAGVGVDAGFSGAGLFLRLAMLIFSAFMRAKSRSQRNLRSATWQHGTRGLMTKTHFHMHHHVACYVVPALLDKPLGLGTTAFQVKREGYVIGNHCLHRATQGLVPRPHCMTPECQVLVFRLKHTKMSTKDKGDTPAASRVAAIAILVRFNGEVDIAAAPPVRTTSTAPKLLEGTVESAWLFFWREGDGRTRGDERMNTVSGASSFRALDRST